MKQNKLVIIISAVAILTIITHLFIASTNETPNFDTEYEKALNQNYKVYTPVLPKKMTFAGEKVPLDNYYVKESLDRELLVNMYWQSNMVLIMKRSARFFPTIEKILKEQGVPEDFKFLCVAESGLMNVTSSAKAQGYWQFVKATGEKYGLEINDEIDERNSLELATVAACSYLKESKERFGSWTAAAAAYNCGENGLARQVNLQNVTDYYHLHLNSETSRYLYRILVIKEIMENPQKYGFHLRYKDLYYPLPYKTITVDTAITSVHQFAEQNNVTYKMLKTLNPWIISTSSVSNKKKKEYTIKLPVKNGDAWETIRNRKSDNTELVTKF